MVDLENHRVKHLNPLDWLQEKINPQTVKEIVLRNDLHAQITSRKLGPFEVRLFAVHEQTNFLTTRISGNMGLDGTPIATSLYGEDLDGELSPQETANLLNSLYIFSDFNRLTPQELKIIVATATPRSLEALQKLNALALGGNPEARQAAAEIDSNQELGEKLRVLTSQQLLKEEACN